MDKLKVLWVDLRIIRDKVSFYHHMSKDWTLSRISYSDQIVREIREIAPVLLCFEYDYPDITSLSMLRKVRYLFPLIPIIMITEQHSEGLAIWALRIRVSDYFVKPLKPQVLITSAATILTQAALQTGTMEQTYLQSNILSNPIPVEVRFRPSQKKRTSPAHTFIETHYYEKIYEEEVAKSCGMNVSTFSRSFKKEHGTTFRNYLINYRIRKARELLQKPNAVVADIAYTVGFHDPSYFTRIFRRFVGMSPSRYHEENNKLGKGAKGDLQLTNNSDKKIKTY